MRSTSFLLLTALLSAGGPDALSGQEVPDTAVAPTIPTRMVAVERGRTRSCVGVFATLQALDRTLQPVYDRGRRINALGQAMSVEDTAEVAPFDRSNGLEQKVADWFAADAELGRGYAQSGDSTILAQRRDLREPLLEELRDSIRALNASGQEMMKEAGDLQGGTVLCQGKILVRPVVLEVCDTLSSPVCAPAQADTADPSQPFRFVEAAADLWDVEQLSPWLDPQPLQRAPDGSVVGGRTAGSVRRGNVRVTVGVGSVIQQRSELTEDQLAEFQGNLDSLGFTFDHPDLIMSPALEVAVDVPEPLDEETHYFLHFGNLSDPASQVVLTMTAGQGGPIRASLPVGAEALDRLEAGDQLSLTAVRVAPGESAEETTSAEALYTIALTPVAQAQAVRSLVTYMKDGSFSRDLERLVPPVDSGG